MPNQTYTNLDQPLASEDFFLGDTTALCQRLVFPAGALPTVLAQVGVFLERQPDPDGGPTGAGTMTVKLGTTAFAGDLGQGLLHPDWLPEGVLQAQMVVLNAALAGATLAGDGYECFLTLEAPRVQRLVKTGHVPAPEGIFGALTSNIDGTVAGAPQPLALVVVARLGSSLLLDDVSAISAADHAQFGAWLQAGSLRKRSRVTVWHTDFGLAPPPFMTEADLPTVSLPVVLREVKEYQITRTDQFTTAELSLTLTLPEYEFHRQRLETNAMLTVDERWGDGATRSGWLRRGTFFLDSVSDSLDTSGARTITVTARDALKLLMNNMVAEKFWPDKIFVPKKRLKKIRDGFTDNLPYHVFVDGDEDPARPGQITHTVMWTDPPKSRLWSLRNHATPTRLPETRGSVDIIHRTGEVWIEREFYKANTKYGGLGDPIGIDAEYYRWALPQDEAITTVKVAGSDFLTLNGPASPAWRGCTVTVLTGAKAKTRLRITDVNAVTARMGFVRFTQQEDALQGIQAGDLVQVGWSNRVEEVVRRVLLLCGFQDLSAAHPFYIETILPPPTANIVTVPADEEFNYRFDKAKSGFDILQSLAHWIPPNVQYKCNALGNAETVIFNPASAPTYAVHDTLGSVELQKSDTDLYTRVIYEVRDRTFLNLAGQTNPGLVAVTVNDETILNGKPITSYSSVFPRDYLANLTDKRERIARVCSDGNLNTGCTWQIILAGHLPPDNLQGRFNNHWLVKWELDKVYKLSEIHMRGVHADWTPEMTLDVEVSLDGEFWETVTDEFHFPSDGDPYQSFDMPDNTYARWVRVLVGHATLMKTTRSKRTIFGSRDVTSYSEIFGFSDLYVYADEIVQGIAELGVDRFDGETDAQFAADQALRTRLGLRTIAVQPVDEQGYEISIAKGLTLAQYAKGRALEFLAEYTNDFNTVRLTGLRPDMNIADMATMGLTPLGLPAASYLVRETTTHSTGETEALATDYRFQGATDGALDSPPTAGTAGTLATGAPESGDDWDGDDRPLEES